MRFRNREPYTFHITAGNCHFSAKCLMLGTMYRSITFKNTTVVTPKKIGFWIQQDDSDVPFHQRRNNLSTVSQKTCMLYQQLHTAKQPLLCRGMGSNSCTSWELRPLCSKALLVILSTFTLDLKIFFYG